ncbi:MULTISPECIES: AAA family ATPase [Terrisporobacter]|nr:MULTISPECIES: AAA family ATPase [Terrisporobacter]MCC3669536.1 AAA family ATPase [Terrisporobacter mayombei]MCR1822331.1 AAA family ATPase [Terrisporobacter muris]MDU6985255.1 SbcC/MukB-like Walker B domain-containing protein [Terrisporobacter othiniensis]MDY3374318.1 SbcC/MukB-like Walker B domain-containing protein [Terrisporobacter othiniensis]
MKPIKLELMGLNSYTDKQTIDFEKLTSRGLFGIFGNTGSGKSTILDAITIALYGDISRDTTDYINSSCDKAIVKYEFEIGSKNNRKRYFVERTIKNSATGGTKTSRVLLGEIKDSGGVDVLADKVGEVKSKIQDIIGLTSDDFTRSVVLPQGKFSEFLKLQDRDRRKMLERIFNLEKYGEKLSNKVKARRNEAKEKITSLNGKLSQHEGITEELYEETIEELLQSKKMEKLKNEDLAIAEKEFEENKIIFEDQKSLQKYIDRKSQIDLKEKEINTKREAIERSERGETIIPHINDIKILEKDIYENSNEVQRLEGIITNIKKEIDLLSIRYEDAKKEKNEKIPLLIEEKGKLQRGIELEEKIEILNFSIKELKKEIDIETKVKEELKKLITDLQNQVDSKYKKIQDNNKNIESLRISTQLKENIFEAYNKEEELKKIGAEREENKNLLKDVNKRIEDLKFRNIDVEKNKSSVNIKLKRLLEHQETLNRSCPGDNKIISSEKEYLHNLKSRLENTKDYEKQINSIKDDLNKNEKSKFDNQRYLNESSIKLERINKAIDDLKEEQGNLIYQNMASYLRQELKDNEPCPVCGSIHHEKIYISANFEEAKLVEEKIKKLEDEYSKEKRDYDELALKNREINSFESIKRKTLNELESKLGDYNSSSLEKEIDIKQKELKILEEKVSSWEEDKNKTIEEIYKIKDLKYDVEKEEVKIKENLNLDRKLSIELKDKIDNLNNKYDNLNLEYLGLKSKVKVNDLAVKVKEIGENEKKVEKLNKEMSILNKEKEDLDKEYKEKESLFNEIDKKLSNLVQHRDTKYKEVKNKEEELNKIAKGISPAKLLQATIDNIDRITNNEKELHEALTNKKHGFDENSKLKSSKDGVLSQAKKQLESKTQTLTTLLIDNKFDSVNSVEKSILPKEEKDKYKGEIEYFDEETKYLIVKISDLNKKLNGRSIKPEEFENLHISINSLKNQIATLRKEIGSKENELKNIEKSLLSIKELTKEVKNVDHELSLLDEINKLIMGNKFVEYVATNQLKYIALEASKRLGSITRGRYALEIDENLNFIMRDNMNGGQRRSVDSLSGGETFLTSLSLALALSSQIQLKGSSPLEFFFLDEGFGSLDTELLEVVMESLENLHNDQLSIGIISHVEELKNRVPVKLIVSPCDVGKGSRVKIEYS